MIIVPSVRCRHFENPVYKSLAMLRLLVLTINPMPWLRCRRWLVSIFPWLPWVNRRWQCSLIIWSMALTLNRSRYPPGLCLVNPMDACQMSFLWRARELQTHKALPATPIRELMLLRQSCKDSLLKWFPLSRLLRSFTSASVQHASAPASCRLFTPV